VGHLGVAVPTVEEEVLQPGDQLLLYTDGVTEARTDNGEFFGFDRLVDFVIRTLADRVSAPDTTPARPRHSGPPARELAG
jgi:serine phosphatase RsbU (regulator of sigma subunit)